MGAISLALALLVLGGEPDRYPGWDKLFIKPQLPLTTVAPTGEVTLLLYHSYPAALHNLRVAVKSETLELTGPAPAIAMLEPTLIKAVKLPLRVKQPSTEDTCTLHVLFTADDVARPEDYTVIVPLTAHGVDGANRSYALPVGQISVFVTPRGNFWYRVECVLFVLVMVWFFRRKRAVNRPHERP